MSCCVLNCAKKHGDESDVRHFLRFNCVPNPKTNKKLCDLWAVKINRRNKDLTHMMKVCSDHFFDENFDPSDLCQARLLYRPRMPIRLRKGAVPNTDPESESTFKEPPRKADIGGTTKSRKKQRRDIDYIDELVHENYDICKCKF